MNFTGGSYVEPATQSNVVDKQQLHNRLKNPSSPIIETIKQRQPIHKRTHVVLLFYSIIYILLQFKSVDLFPLEMSIDN